MKLHTILGAGGAVSNELLPVLINNNEKVRLVSRRAQPIANVEAVAADITDYLQTLNAIKGSSIVYLLVGLQYDIKVWSESWPKIMTNVINACKETGSKLVFFDNVYMYGMATQNMTEETPFNPCSKKGEVRAAIATQLLREMKAGNIQAMIARSADFYGPVGFETSMPNMLVFANFKKGRKAQWLINAKLQHSFTYVPDAAKALYLLANDDNAYGQTWHLPTSAETINGETFIKQAAQAMVVENRYSILPLWMMRVAGLVIKPIKESVEMAYQNGFTYNFNSEKFNKAYNFKPTSYINGISNTAAWTLEQ